MSYDDDLQSWQFHPASHNSAAVDVDVVIEIPFRLPPQGRQWCRQDAR